MARAPDARTEQAKELFLSGKKLIEIAQLLGVPEGTVRSWKNRYKWDCSVANEKRNVAKKIKADSQEIKMLLVTAARGLRAIKMQLRQESLKLSFLIA